MDKSIRESTPNAHPFSVFSKVHTLRLVQPPEYQPTEQGFQEIFLDPLLPSLSDKVLVI